MHSIVIRESRNAPLIQLCPGKLIVLEGLDGVGKSTTSGELARLPWKDPPPLFTHQPSSATILGDFVHHVAHDRSDLPALALQLLHLASHAEHYETVILPELKNRAIVLDRCWWSTIAYGYYGALLASDFKIDEFERLSRAPTRGRMPDLVFLFLNRVEGDEEITRIEDGYRQLMTRFPDVSMEVPLGDIAEVTDFIVGVLLEREMAKV